MPTIVSILREGLDDQHPEVRKEACHVIVLMRRSLASRMKPFSSAPRGGPLSLTGRSRFAEMLSDFTATQACTRAAGCAVRDRIAVDEWRFQVHP